MAVVSADESIPTSLFKYRPIDVLEGSELALEARDCGDTPRRMGRLEALIKTGAVYFSHPRLFNDPFECRPLTLYDPKGKNTVPYLQSRMRELRPDETAARRLLRAAQLRRKYAQPRCEENGHEKIFQNVGLLCLVERPDNLLMWSHYGESHRGVCLEFDTSEWLFRFASRIEYSEKYSVVDTANQDPNEILRQIFLRKSVEWAYEQEWRIVSYKGLFHLRRDVQELYSLMKGSGVHLMPNRLLKRIIFGVNASDEAVELVKSWVREAGISCAYSRCKLDGGRYRLLIETLR